MVKRGHEVDLEYSKKIIINKMNVFLGNNVVEKIKLNDGLKKTISWLNTNQNQ